MKNIMVILWVLLTLTACGYKEGVIIPDEKAFLSFSGETNDVEILWDGNALLPVSNNEDGKIHIYQVEPGKHQIEIQRDGNVIVKRSLMLSKGTTKEINIPK